MSMSTQELAQIAAAVAQIMSTQATPTPNVPDTAPAKAPATLTITGKSLAEIDAMGLTPANRPLIAAALDLRADRYAEAGKSEAQVTRTREAAERVRNGESAAPAPKAPKGTNPNTPTLAATAKAKLESAATQPQMSAKVAFDFVAKAAKAGGHSVPRWLSGAAKTGEVKAKA